MCYFNHYMFYAKCTLASSNICILFRSMLSSLYNIYCIELYQQKFLLIYDPGDEVARVSRSSTVVLYTLLPYTMHVASCSGICNSLLQSSLIIYRFLGLPSS